MNVSKILKLCLAIFPVFLVYKQRIIECNIIGEWEFQNFHPNLTNLHWKQLENMTAEDRERICLQVLKDMTPPVPSREEDSEEDSNASNSTVITADVIENCQVKFRHDLVPMSLIKCDHKRLTFYLADGDDNHVFALRNNSQNYYTFLGTAHNVSIHNLA